MNLLLLLSAILSALTGATAGVRRAEPAQAVAQGTVTARAAVATVRQVAMRFVAPAVALRTVSIAPAASPAARIVAVPIWTSRRRE